MDDFSPPNPVKFVSRILDELGLVSLYRSTIDTKLLCFQRFVRLFAYGGSTLILVSYLSALGIPDTRIGLFMTLTLIGDVVISFFLTLVADGLGRKTTLALGAALMAGSGVVFGVSGNYWVLLTAAIFGVISPSGNEIGPFRAIEESTLAYLSPAAVRSDIFAWYSLIGTAGTAFGMIICGWVVHILQSEKGWNDIRAYRLMFFAYAVIGVIKFVLACALSEQCELEKEPKPVRDSETAPLLANDGAGGTKPKKEKKSILPSISKESRGILINLSILFALDSFASGLAPLSWVTNFFKRKFDLSEGYLGSLFFTTSIISAVSILVAASIAKRIGNVKTMVYTHLTSAMALAMIGIPSQIHFAAFFVILRSCTQSMDVAPRSAFLAAVILPNERTATMGFINVVKTSAQSLGPLITGVLAEKGLFWIAFILAGSFKTCYDLGMLLVFAGHKPREERGNEEREAAEQNEILREEEDPDER